MAKVQKVILHSKELAKVSCIGFFYAVTYDTAYIACLLWAFQWVARSKLIFYLEKRVAQRVSKNSAHKMIGKRFMKGALSSSFARIIEPASRDMVYYVDTEYYLFISFPTNDEFNQW